MRITFAPRGVLQIDEARITYKNFGGKGSKYNREGDRNFAVIIDNIKDAETLRDAGWNVKIKDPREEGDDPFMYLTVKVKFNDMGPHIHLVSGNKRRRLTPETAGIIDDIDIANIDLDIRPYDWEVNGKSGRTAYLQSIKVTQRIIDRFAEDEEEDY